MFHRRAPRIAGGALFAATLTSSLGAVAGGLEVPDNGAVAFGRGGAFVARASDPTALIHNTAAIMGLRGVQITLGSNFGVFNQCFQRLGNYDSDSEASISTAGTRFEDSNYAQGGVPYPRVCNDGGVSYTPHLLGTWRINRYVAIGFGLYAPNSTGSRQVFADSVMTSAGPAPSPVRNMVYEKSLLAFHVTLAAAFAPTPWLRFGLALQPSYASFRFVTMANSVLDSAQSPDSDVRISLEAQGMFLAGNLGLQVLPLPWLSFGAHAHFNPTANLSGTGNVVANYYAANPSNQVSSDFTLARMSVPLPWTFRFGARFALPRPGRPHQNDPVGGQSYDPMTDDIFDVEAAFSYETTSRMGVISLENTGTISTGQARVPAPGNVEVRSDYRDVVGFRLGGDVNIVPGVLAVRAGFSYETGAQSTQFAQLHLPTYSTTSVHLGLSVRAAFLTISAGYGHYFMADFAALDGNRTVIATGGTLDTDRCARGPGPGACQVNRGTYNANFDALSVAVSARF